MSSNEEPERSNRMTPVERAEYVERLSNAIQTIGYARLLTLPTGIKTYIQNSADLEKKVKMLERIVETINKEGGIHTPLS